MMFKAVVGVCRWLSLKYYIHIITRSDVQTDAVWINVSKERGGHELGRPSRSSGVIEGEPATRQDRPIMHAFSYLKTAMPHRLPAAPAFQKRNAR